MIPKVIHYCWFGRNPLPILAQKCIESWKKYCPDYEIKEWNEDNFPMDYNDYVKEAYEAKKWAFITDVVRLFALVTEGGIYMDTDVEVIKPLDGLLQYEAVSGFEPCSQIPTGLMASEAHQPLFEELLRDYDKRRWNTRYNNQREAHNSNLFEIWLRAKQPDADGERIYIAAKRFSLSQRL